VRPSLLKREKIHDELKETSADEFVLLLQMYTNVNVSGSLLTAGIF
jgi:hypothetical protein